ncbi:hypothetical protein [Lampropedia aestuarii]|nr:hypothetical protein [Lampropedia aestuarii]
MSIKTILAAAIITSVSLGAFFPSESTGMKADRVVAQIAAEQGKGLE